MHNCIENPSVYLHRGFSGKIPSWIMRRDSNPGPTYRPVGLCAKLRNATPLNNMLVATTTKKATKNLRFEYIEQARASSQSKQTCLPNIFLY